MKLGAASLEVLKHQRKAHSNEPSTRKREERCKMWPQSSTLQQVPEARGLEVGLSGVNCNRR